MGCDIHAVIEGKRPCDWLRAGFQWVVRDEPDIPRDYELFAFLADVRNDDGIVPIAEPKGIPQDASYVTKAYAESWGEDGHSRSHLSLAELKTADLDQEFNDSRLITSRDKDGKITSTRAWTSGSHEGPVGHRKLFRLWGLGTWNTLLSDLEQAKREGQGDDDVRLVFFFDN